MRDVTGVVTAVLLLGVLIAQLVGIEQSRSRDIELEAVRQRLEHLSSVSPATEALSQPSRQINAVASGGRFDDSLWMGADISCPDNLSPRDGAVRAAFARWHATGGGDDDLYRDFLIKYGACEMIAQALRVLDR